MLHRLLHILGQSIACWKSVLWERIAWGLNVRLNITVEAIEVLTEQELQLEAKLRFIPTRWLLSKSPRCEGQSELGMLRTLWGILLPGDVMLADRYMCAWTEMIMLKERGVDLVTRINQHRRVD